MSTNILLLCGGDGAEHDISLISADFIEQQLKQTADFNVIRATMHEQRFITAEGEGAFDARRNFCTPQSSYQIDCVVPCLHGVPGETGDIQSFCRILNLPYIGCDSEASRKCFNKVTTKFYFDALGLPNTPFALLNFDDEVAHRKAAEFFDRYGDIYVKAASQGSSVGCYHVTKREELQERITEAFGYSSEVLLEKNIVHRELEVAAYEYDGQLCITTPGEIIMPDNVFYTFEEKYSKNSATVTTVEPQGLKTEEVENIRSIARQAFIGLKLRDLSRIDFFLSPTDGILINEINTFPGQTPISMFPKLLEHNGHNMAEFLRQAVQRAMQR